MKNNIDRDLRRPSILGCFLAVTICVCGTVLAAQSAPSATVASENTAPASPKVEKPAPIPLAEVATDAETVSDRLRDILAELLPDPITDEIAEQLPILTREIDARLRESRRIIAQRPSVEILVTIEAEWRRLRRNLSGWTADLTSRATRIERQMAVVDELERTWEQTLNAAKSSNAPLEVLRRIEAVVTQIKQARETIDKQRARVLTMQSRVALQDARIADALTSIGQGREDVLKRLFVRDGPAIWSAELRSSATRDVLEETSSSLFTQWAALSFYVARQPIQFFLHAAIFIGLAAGLYWTRHQVHPEPKDEAGTTLVFEMPIAAALILSFLCVAGSIRRHPGSCGRRWERSRLFRASSFSAGYSNGIYIRSCTRWLSSTLSISSVQ